MPLLVYTKKAPSVSEAHNNQYEAVVSQTCMLIPTFTNKTVNKTPLSGLTH